MIFHSLDITLQPIHSFFSHRKVFSVLPEDAPFPKLIPARCGARCLCCRFQFMLYLNGIPRLTPAGLCRKGQPLYPVRLKQQDIYLNPAGSDPACNKKINDINCLHTYGH